MRRFGLLGRFALASGIAIVLLWAVLARVESDRVRTRAISEAAASTELLVQVGLQPILSPEDLKDGIDADTMPELDEAFATGLESGTIVRIKIWSPAGQIVYSDDHELIGQRFPIAHDLEEALAGEIEAEISELDEAENVGERGYGALLEVYVPIRFGADEPVVGVFELYVPYDPIAESIAADTRRLSLLLMGGLVLLWAVLFRIVVGASRRLRRDRAELGRRADENRYLALHDQLTDLPNRMLFRDRLGQAIAAANREGTSIGVLILDLDRFKEVNDTLGHEGGDQVLTEVGPRLRGVLRGVDTVARMGGDEFGILLGGVKRTEEVEPVARKVAQALDLPFRIDDIEVALGGSIGIAVYPTHGTGPEILMRRAEIAMYVAKAARARVEVYSQEHDHYSKERLALLAELRRSIEAGQLGLHYQPKIDLVSGGVVGVEALARWRHPEHGAIAPDVFIPLAEQSGLIRRLTSAVIDTALSQCRAWRQRGIDLPVAVNLSMRDVLDPGLPDEVSALLGRYGLPASALELEITESSVMEHPTRAVEVLDRLSGMGVGLAIDDFGTGYSSLAYLQRLPVGQLKIDRSFVMDLSRNESDAEIVRSTIDLGHNLGLVVVAEGVEDTEAFAFLAGAGCDIAQGFHIAKPMPADELEAWLRATGERSSGRIPASQTPGSDDLR